MRRLILLSAMAAVVATGPTLAAPKSAPKRPPAPAVAGLWKLPDDNVVIRIAACGQAVCGHLVSADKLKANPKLKDKMNSDPAQRGRPVRGLPILWDFTGGPTQWTGGKVYNPDDGRTYKSELTLAGDGTLDVKGCVVKPLCKSRTLTRVR